MKRTLLSILIFVTHISNAQTSVYHPFPDSAAIWNFHFSQYCFSDGNGDENYSITFSGDTLINSQKYHKITIPFVQSFSTGICVSGKVVGYRGAVRQDKINKKVFYIPPANSSEQLLYDFNMQIGDTVRSFIEPTTKYADVVKAIDSVLVGSTYRKRWEINPGYHIYFIEGIGSTYGLIESSPGGVDFPGYSITCFQQDKVGLYPSAIGTCELISSVNSIVKEKEGFNIYPNPGKDNVCLTINTIEKTLLQVFDLTGKLMLAEFLQNERSTIDVSRLPQGVYNLCVSNNESKGNKRLVIIK
jgi:hypothetical protein